MQKPLLDQERLKDKTNLAFRVNYFSSVFSLLFFLACLNILNIYKVIPWVFLAFGLLNLFTNVIHKYHKNLYATYIATSIYAMISATIIILFSGGINSPFIFILALVVFSGYATNRIYGKISLYLNLALIILIYILGLPKYNFTPNVVPNESKDLFALLSILFSVFILGAIVGKHLLRVHHSLYRAKREMTKRINEKETLLKEIHHRVKNNLQTISSLLSLQSNNIEDKKMKNLIKSSQNRVISMAMIHEMLYMRDDISKIDYKSYVIELCEYLIRSIKGPDSNIKLSLDIPDIRLGINTAIPLGLLINEIITNALKYGIKGEYEGNIYVDLKRDGDNGYLLKIGDDGTGYPDNVSHENTKSLGLKLIHNLTRQLRGVIIRDFSKKGTNYVINFKEINEHFPDEVS
ncbi:two-component sensor histidine kinase [Saonia flava]|uniref:histidine kinase n=1 Tax=Saonia flava TaxID=523696 RepID=A0A846R330_9FLAO|nr:sensor histidine kinase [Saonia flava]NJB72375.1 two-component sensor histidine kinase [Saonia flava]